MKRYIAAVDSHTEGMPTRVVTGGVGPIPGATMLERKLHFEAELDDLRLLLMREPRGHSAMSGAILQPPTRPDADWGVLFIEVSGLLPLARFDMTPKLVQYFKAAQDEVGLAGGPCRAPRLPLTTGEREDLAAAMAVLRAGVPA